MLCIRVCLDFRSQRRAILSRMSAEPLVPAKPSSPNLVTLASIGATACTAADMVHEALGHGTASWLTGDRILAISTVALVNASANRFVCAAGTSANCIVGALCFLALRRMRTFTPLAYFLWMFGAYNLLNSGYMVLSAIGNGTDDWTRVIAGLSPPVLWRTALGLTGAAIYVLTIHWASTFANDWVERGEVALAAMWRLILPAYIAGGIVMTTASVFNPISRALIFGSAVLPSFGLNFGLLFLPAIVAANTRNRASFTRPLPFSFFWLAVGIAASGVFIGVLGPGVRFSH
jgi:hypothetical protein